MMTLGLILVAIGTLCFAFDWPRILGGVPYYERRHRVYEILTHGGVYLLIAGCIL